MRSLLIYDSHTWEMLRLESQFWEDIIFFLSTRYVAYIKSITIFTTSDVSIQEFNEKRNRLHIWYCQTRIRCVISRGLKTKYLAYITFSVIECHLARVPKSKIGKLIQIHPFYLVHPSIQYLSHKKLINIICFP